MTVDLLDGGQTNWKPHLKANAKLAEEKSSHHLAARSLLKEVYPTLQVLEEVWVPLTHSDYCYLDFFLPLIKVAVEVQGQQHSKYNPFFHSTYRDFLKQQKRDRDKKSWLSINGISLAELQYSESIEEWKNKLKN